MATGKPDLLKSDNLFADIVIIGSGIACTLTLTCLFEQLLLGKAAKKLKLIVIEKHDELWKGIPYGSRSSVNGLTITTIRDFFTNEIEFQQFSVWFNHNLGYFTKEFKARGGDAAESWLADNKNALTENQWGDVYLPRFIIGDYIQQKFEALKREAETQHLIDLEIVNGDATSVMPTSNGYSVAVIEREKSFININAPKMVLAIGSAPERKLSNVFEQSSEVLYIDKIYTPSMEANLDRICSKLIALKKSERNILIVGSNASTIELLYLVNNSPSVLNLVNTITILSTSGKLPAHITYKLHEHEVNANLKSLEAAGSYTINSLVAAASKDIEAMHEHEVSVPDIDTVVGHTLKLLQPLNEDAKKLFYGIYGVQLAKLFRRSGTEYKKASEALLKSGKLKLLKGKFTEIDVTEGHANLTYKDADTGQPIKSDNQFNVVINNTGSEDLVHSSSPLIKNLISKNHLKVNHSGKAFEVNDKLEAAPNLYIIGPLIGGNYNSLLKFWHLENASRIMYLAPYLVKELLIK